MQNVFPEVNSLDKICYEKYGLSEDILMENASLGIKKEIDRRFKRGSKILILAGSGNNGADGITLARQLHMDYEVELYLVSSPKSDMAKLQLQRAKNVGVAIADGIKEADVVVDAIFGSGLRGGIDRDRAILIERVNSIEAYKIACDIPSGLEMDGNISSVAFKADITVTMGALKLALFSDHAKNVCGEIVVADLGISRKVYENNSNYFMLEMCDLKLPFRDNANSHKGSYGHLGVFCGEKEGAAVIASQAALSFGVGLCTIIKEERPINLPSEIMHSKSTPTNATALAIGMGLGRDASLDGSAFKHRLLLDADIFFNNNIEMILSKCKEAVLTPHPKEFSELLKRCGLGDYSVKEVQEKRFKLASAFSKKYPEIVLILKGANTIIAKSDKLYINPHGTEALAKGGSGDVLSGLVGSLLAQGYDTLDAAINASLAHSKASKVTDINNYAMLPQDIIEKIKRL